MKMGTCWVVAQTNEGHFGRDIARRLEFGGFDPHQPLLTRDRPSSSQNSPVRPSWPSSDGRWTCGGVGQLWRLLGGDHNGLSRVSPPSWNYTFSKLAD